MTLTQETYVRNKRTKPQGKSENYDISLNTASYHTPLTRHKTKNPHIPKNHQHIHFEEK